MKIKSLKVYRQDLALTRPYTIARETVSAVENVFLEIELANGIVGIGAANPAPEVVGETPDQTYANLQSEFVQNLVGRDIRHFQQLIDETIQHFSHLPGTQAAIDIALHDVFGQFLGIPIVEFYGQKHHSLPTSVTIGIKSVAETLAEAQEYYEHGFRVLKVKTGLDVKEDVERILKLREKYGNHFTIRVDANQGYQLIDLQQFIKKTQSANIELIEQPLAVKQTQEMAVLSSETRKILCADESLKSPEVALQLAQSPQFFGIYNIKLMKCGGIRAALEIATIARNAQIQLFWGCNDESIVSITAALHAAFACKNTHYIDLDGSLDLAEDVVKGGFILKDGLMSLSNNSGLGVERIS